MQHCKVGILVLTKGDATFTNKQQTWQQQAAILSPLECFSPPVEVRQWMRRLRIEKEETFNTFEQSYENRVVKRHYDNTNNQCTYNNYTYNINKCDKTYFLL